MIMIQRMAKPEEVLVVKDPDTGEIIRERQKDSDAVALLYKTMRETLIFLTHLDHEVGVGGVCVCVLATGFHLISINVHHRSRFFG